MFGGFYILKANLTFLVTSIFKNFKLYTLILAEKKEEKMKSKCLNSLFANCYHTSFAS